MIRVFNKWLLFLKIYLKHYLLIIKSASISAYIWLFFNTNTIFWFITAFAGIALIIFPVYTVFKLAYSVLIGILRLTLSARVFTILKTSLDKTSSAIKSIMIQAVNTFSSLITKTTIISLLAGPSVIQIKSTYASNTSIII